MKKKVVSLCLVALLAMGCLIGGTMAYFTDNDQASNTFELGGVDITLTERAYVNGAWKDIENPDGVANLGQLDPVSDDWATVTRAGYAYNKCVFTINNEDDAYIRNYVAIESLENAEGEDDVFKIWYCNAGVDNPSEAPGAYRHGSSRTAKIENVEIDKVFYDIYVFDTIDDKEVKKGESFQSLSTVILDDWVTNEDIDALGDTYEVYTYSEAIQVTGFANHAAAMTALIGDDGDLETHATNLLKAVMGK